VIGISLAEPYRNKGYGSEAIRWILNWGFKTAGLHRIGIKVFAFNEGACRLYERLGFVREGIARESIFHDGKWWDEIELSMLDHEWRAMEEKKKSSNA
jgi:RimJ/RimL family protein N-acetyltransferase